ncbi:MAG: glycoside hydrolase family 10 protein [Planctomycetota bacterium]
MKRCILFFAAASLTILAGCQTSPRARIHAIWVTRSDYRTAGDVVQVMDNCERAGFNTVLFQVRGNGTAFYRSAIEPWAEELGGQDPGFDPLGLALEEARKRDLGLHAWVNVMPAWRGPGEPADPNQLYHKRPEWFWYDAQGTRQPLVHQVGDRRRAWYVSVNPCLPEVRAYLVEVFREIVQNYDVDGLHLDYIRFPCEPVVKGERIPDYPRDKQTLALFKPETGLAPAENKEAWNRWRTAKVTRLVADIHDMMRQTRPDATLSAAVGTNRKRSLKYHRDAKHWVEQRIVDTVFPMNYKPSLEAFAEGLTMWTPPGGDVTLVPGLWIDRKLSVEQGIAVARQQIQAAVEQTGSFCLFTYNSLFDSAADNRVSSETRSKRQRQRALRRAELLPLIRGLSQDR